MDKDMLGRILKARRQSTRPFEVKVTGTSMEPVLHEGDIIRIKPMSIYEQGDIIVFQYKNEGLLSHRILEIENGRYFCKGDNSFRMEDINEEQIIGKVIQMIKNDGEIFILPCSRALTLLSKAVNREFIKFGYDIEAVMKSETYHLYKRIILENKGEDIMLYKKNERMDYITEDEQNLIIFDPDSGDTHFVDEIGIDILNLLDIPMDIDEIVNRMSSQYEAPVEEIRKDVEEFMVLLTAKKVVGIL